MRTLLLGGTPTLKQFPFGHQGAVHPGGSLSPLSRTPGVGRDPGWTRPNTTYIVVETALPWGEIQLWGWEGCLFQPRGKMGIWKGVCHTPA